MSDHTFIPAAKGNDGLRFPFASAPAPGTLTDVAPGVKWLRMPLPFVLNHINLWILDDGDGWTLVDTGANTAKTRDLWREIFSGPLAVQPLKRVICTHFHPDHMGLAGWLSKAYGVPVWSTQKEIATARRALALSDSERRGVDVALFVHAGLERPADDESRREDGYKSLVTALPDDIPLLQDKDVINAAATSWRVVVGEGHSPELSALHAQALNLLISGDQVLPGITPHVGIFDIRIDENPLQLFLDSLAHFRKLPEDTLVLPSHKLPFFGLRARIDQIIAHHHERLDRVRVRCAQGATAAEVLPAIFERTFDGSQLRFALGETFAHLNCLMGTGEIVRETTPQGAYLYRTVAAPAAAA
jgi:glyoxylase-like metal-dependent hydrolase (beta-lactamase superfamily II)